MTLINLKFHPEMEEKILAGLKCCTTRDKKKGKVGDIFVVQDRVYRIVHTHHSAMYAIKEGYYNAEGFDSPQEFARFWTENIGEFDQIQTGYLHFFAYVGEWCPQFGVPGAACSDPETFCELFRDCRSGSA